jgi:hypothetical protein
VVYQNTSIGRWLKSTEERELVVLANEAEPIMGRSPFGVGPASRSAPAGSTLARPRDGRKALGPRA